MYIDFLGTEHADFESNVYFLFGWDGGAMGGEFCHNDRMNVQICPNLSGMLGKKETGVKWSGFFQT